MESEILIIQNGFDMLYDKEVRLCSSDKKYGAISEISAKSYV